MKRTEIISLLDSLIPSLYGFSYALIPDELQAEQLVLDAYSVFLIREKAEIQDIQLENAKDRAAAKRFLLTSLLTDIYELAKKRAPQLKSSIRNVSDFSEFYRLELLQRAALSCKERLRLSNGEIGEIFALQSHQVTETLHNARVVLENSLNDVNITNGAVVDRIFNSREAKA